ncbi:MAG: fructosamine kinase family protein [Snowella sp.]
MWSKKIILPLNSMWKAIAKNISETIQRPFEIEQKRPVSGGCINQGYAITGNGLTYFVKLNQASQQAMFIAESLGLQQMAKTQTIRVPQSICLGISEKSSYLVLEWLELGGATSGSWLEMGRKLAAMHRHSGSNQFGWEQDNTIGSTTQVNPWTTSWADFFAEYRIGYQLRLAQRKGGNFTNSTEIIEKTRHYLKNRNPQPSLVHGDLWSGNAAILKTGEPVIFDPAVYYGDREVDIAMTELFGGFPAAFYWGYNEIFPLDSGYSDRKTLYNLYHILNHFNLFGGGYGSQAQGMIQQIFPHS